MLVLPTRGLGGVNVEGGVLRYDPTVEPGPLSAAINEAIADCSAPRPARTQSAPYLAEDLRVGVMIVTETHAVWANEAACQAVGLSHAELVSAPYWSWIHPDDQPDSVVAVEQNVTEQRPPMDLVNRWVTHGTVRRLRWCATPPDARGHMHCTVHLIDIAPAAAELETA